MFAEAGMPAFAPPVHMAHVCGGALSTTQQQNEQRRCVRLAAWLQAFVSTTESARYFAEVANYMAQQFEVRVWVCGCGCVRARMYVCRQGRDKAEAWRLGVRARRCRCAGKVMTKHRHGSLQACLAAARAAAESTALASGYCLP